MTIEQLLDKLENDRQEAERVRNNCYQKSCDLHAKIKDFSIALRIQMIQINNWMIYDLSLELLSMRSVWLAITQAE